MPKLFSLNYKLYENITIADVIKQGKITVYPDGYGVIITFTAHNDFVNEHIEDHEFYGGHVDISERRYYFKEGDLNE